MVIEGIICNVSIMCFLSLFSRFAANCDEDTEKRLSKQDDICYVLPILAKLTRTSKLECLTLEVSRLLLELS